MGKLCYAVSVGLIMLIVARAALKQHEAAGNPTAPAEMSVTASSQIDRVDECIDSQACIDIYLWSLYERTRKVDTVRVPEQIKVAVKRKGKIKIVTKAVSKFVVEDFGWKDPDAAEKAGIATQDYVIGGMDRSFRVTLYRALRALDAAGLMPGITSGFRDNYRQNIATGEKALSDRSYHGGSFHGGYGHGQAADIVSVKGQTRADRLVSSNVLWRWIDTHEKELGIGRPYRDRDAPHVGPLDGREYLAHRGEPKSQAGKARLADRRATAIRTIRPRRKSQAESKACRQIVAIGGLADVSATRLIRCY
jgi:hypothetical protein